MLRAPLIKGSKDGTEFLPTLSQRGLGAGLGFGLSGAIPLE
jgi:hypothetical protein